MDWLFLHFKSAWLAGFCAWAIALSSTAASNSPLETQLAHRLLADGPAVSILVAREGKVLFCHAYGMADRERSLLATPETVFRIGSVTKQFTAAAILRLAESGRLAISDPLTKYFPDYPGGGKITLRHLLTHTSGLHNYTEHPDFLAQVAKPISPAELVAWFEYDAPDFSPGAEFRYSNTGYVLLGQIIEKVSGQSYATYLQQQFFDPLGMKSTGVWRNQAPPARAALGYSYVKKKLEPALDWDMSWAGGAGSLYSTVGDLWRWTEALQGGQVLAPASWQLMTSEFTVAKKSTLTQRYCMGLARTDIDWLPAIGHDGGVNGYLSEVMWLPEQKTTVAVLSAALPALPQSAPQEIVPLVVRELFPDEVAAHAPKVDASVDAKTYPDFVGRYDYGEAIQEITTQDGHLYAQLTGQDRFEVFPSGPDAFFFKITPASLNFLRDKSGAVIAVTHHQHGSSFEAQKLTDQERPTLTLKALDEITGRYQYGPGAVLTVTRRGPQLFAQLTGQPEFPIFPKSGHEFFWRVVAASFEVSRDAAGTVIGVIHHQGGLTFPAPKLKSP